MPRLTKTKVDFIMTIKEVNRTNCETAMILGVTEWAVRYRIRRELSGQPDGRRDKPAGIALYCQVTNLWLEENMTEQHIIQDEDEKVANLESLCAGGTNNQKSSLFKA